MLSVNAQKIINSYFNLPFAGLSGVRCPYFNNAKARQRGQLKALIGKGTPKEIVEETQIISTQYHAKLFSPDGQCCLPDGRDEKMGEGELRRFLIDHNLGIDCSGFITHVLRAHFLDTAGADIAKKFVKNISAPWWRKIIMRLRPVESIGVKSGYANDKNTKKIGDEKTGYDYSKLQAGDVIVMLETGPAFALRASAGNAHKRNHIILITDCDGQKIKYVHARAWSAEGQYGHGVNSGEIKIINPGQGLLAQEWLEKSPAQDDLFHQTQPNETYLEAKQAKILEIRRVKI